MKNAELQTVFQALCASQPNTTALLANASAFINETLDQINWVGFYLYDGQKLHVGPFQGRVACSTIELGKGVCGTAAIRRQTQIVDDVLAHDNHIACDENSRSEVVIPIIIKNELFGVLDVDSPIFNRFDTDTVLLLESFVSILGQFIDI
ncbi:MAG: GAF domain-containing protein [Acholeplasmataceae bacterium]|nr:GAF domain-containing protein [Acholeplasmataceae bacterium]